MGTESPSEYAKVIATRAQRTSATEKIDIIPELAEEFARLIDQQHYGGSADFSFRRKDEIKVKDIFLPLLIFMVIIDIIITFI